MKKNRLSHILKINIKDYGDRLSKISQDYFDRLAFNNQISPYYLALGLFPEFLISIVVDQNNIKDI